MKFPSIKNLLIAGGVILIFLAAVAYFRKPGKIQDEISVDSTLVQETEMNEPAKEEKGLSPAEQQQARNSIDKALEDLETESTILKDVSGGKAYGTAYRLDKENHFYHKAVLRDLPSPEKGFFFEGWLVDPAGKYFSTGRVIPEETQGLLYYQSDKDETAYNQVVITLEPEDDNPAPDKHILEGKF